LLRLEVFKKTLFVISILIVLVNPTIELLLFLQVVVNGISAFVNIYFSNRQLGTSSMPELKFFTLNILCCLLAGAPVYFFIKPLPMPYVVELLLSFGVFGLLYVGAAVVLMRKITTDYWEYALFIKGKIANRSKSA
jgi:hypothetical protein